MMINSNIGRRAGNTPQGSPLLDSELLDSDLLGGELLDPLYPTP